MIRRTTGIRPLGLTLLAIAGLMALMATAASANWLVGLAEFDGNKQAEAAKHTEPNLLVPGLDNLEILCATIENQDILIVGLTEEGTGGVHFRNCKAWQNKVNVSANCTPVEPIEMSFKILIILHNSQNYIKFTPPTGQTKFGQIKFNGLFCALNPTNNVSGELIAECGQLEAGFFTHKDCAEDAKSRLLKANQTALFGKNLAFGTVVAELDGIASVALIGEPFWAGHV